MAFGAVVVREEDEEIIIKPRNDKREYRRIVLENELQVLLISDPETDKCAASMDVRVGSFSDPEGLEGLAHFLEHMLFYASEKYPVEDSYSKYITEHGGSTNAFTSSENTNYHFDVNPDCFEEALDRFAQFFIKPLMSVDASMREIKAVDSENQKNLLSDSWRMSQLQKHLSAKHHPYHKFSTGNLDTLAVQPKERGCDTREELLKFYSENYSANLMHLVVYDKDDLDKAESRVRSKFQEIRNINRSSICFPGKPFDSENLQILVKAVPIKHGHKLRFLWPITPGIHQYKKGTSWYMAHLIGHEGEGSLFFVLKKLGWAAYLQAGESDWSYEYAFFEVVIYLTDAGQEHFEDIVGLLFKFIQLLQQAGPCQRIFDELVAIAETAFHYQDKIDPIDYVGGVVHNMQFYPIRDWLVGSSLPSKFDPEKISSALKELSPHNVIIFWESSNFGGDTDLREPWYGTAYSVEQLSGFKIEQWVEKASNEDLHLPLPNVFIPTDLTLKTVSDRKMFPVLLRKTTYSNVWYKPDTAFFTPKACIMIYFNCPFSRSCPEYTVLTEIFTRLVMDYLNEYAYDAEVAGLYYSVSNAGFGFQVSLAGYNHKLKILLETVIDRIAHFEVKPDRFAVIKELVKKEYQNVKFQQPYQQALYNNALLLHDQSFPWTDELEVLPSLEAGDLLNFYPLLLSRTFLECYAAGNIEPNEAESMIEHIESVFFRGAKPLSQALFASQYMEDRIIKLERGVNYVYATECLNPADENSALIHYIQVHQDEFKMNVLVHLFTLVAKQPAFHQLRSVEQLGYIAMLTNSNETGVRGLQFIIQSTVKGPGQIDLRVESFLRMFEQKLHEMSSDEFKSNVNALVEMKLEKHKNLAEESGFFWQEISGGTLKFDRWEREVEELKQLSQQELIDFFDEHVKIGAPRKKSLSVRVYGNKHTLEMKSDNSRIAESNDVVLIDDLLSFRRSRPLYGSLRRGGGLKI